MAPEPLAQLLLAGCRAFHTAHASFPDGWPGRFAAFDLRFVQMAYVFSSLCGGREGWCGSPLVASHTSPGPDLGPRLCAALSSLSHRGVVVGRRWGPSSLRPRQLRGSGSQSGRWALSSLVPFVLAPSSASRLRRRLALASCPLGWLPWRGRGESFSSISGVVSAFVSGICLGLALSCLGLLCASSRRLRRLAAPSRLLARDRTSSRLGLVRGWGVSCSPEGCRTSRMGVACRPGLWPDVRTPLACLGVSSIFLLGGIQGHALVCRVTE